MTHVKKQPNTTKENKNPLTPTYKESVFETAKWENKFKN